MDCQWLRIYITMRNIDFWRKTTFVIHEANYTSVGKEWENVGAVYPYNRIYLIKEGLAEIEVNGENVVLEPGWLYFFPAFQISHVKLHSPLTHYYIHFISSAESEFYNLMDNCDFLNKIPYREELETVFQIAMANRLQRDAMEIFQEEAVLRLLLAPFIVPNSFRLPENERVMEVVNYINANIEKNITVEQMAQIAGYTRSHFCVVFRKVFKIPPKEYVLQLKIKKAQELMMNKSLSISEISNELGFYSYSYFTRLFKSKTNFSPSEYRKQLLGGMKK